MNARIQYRGIAGAIIRYGQRLRKALDCRLITFDVESDALDDYAGMAIENADPGEMERYI